MVESTDVQDVKADIASNKLTVVGKVDPAKVKERVEEKTRKKAEIVSVHPKKEAAAAGGGGDKKPDEKKADEKKAEDKKPKEVRKTHPPTITRGGATKMGPPLEHSKFC